MTVVSTKEFSTNQKKYFDMAVNEQVIIQREDYKKPDEKLRNAITLDEVRDRLHSHNTQIVCK